MTFEQMCRFGGNFAIFNIKKALFVGLSDGANLAMVYASRYPDRIWALT